jgi:predicted Zn finger-like uncharacterized protein
MPQDINCPACSAKLRVGEDKLGKKVRCPKCKEIFVTEEEAHPIELVEAIAQPVFDDEPPPVVEEDDQNEERARRKKKRKSAAVAALKGPALAMAILAYVGLSINAVLIIACVGLLLISVLSGSQQAPPPPQKFGGPRQLPLVQDLKLLIFVSAFFGGLAYVWYDRVLRASTSMSTLRGYQHAVVGCVMAMLPCCGVACVGGIPVGIWSLVVLSRSEVKDAFRS